MDKHDEQPEILERYADPTLETLGELLDQLAADGAMDLEELDGFFTALHCAPQLVPREEYLLEIFGSGDALDNDEIFSGPDSAKLLSSLLNNFWTSVYDALSSGEPFVPLLLQDDDGKVDGTNWAKGFMHGVEMRQDLWEELSRDESRFAWIAPIISLSYENHPNPDLRPFKTPLTGKEREILLKEVSRGVSEMYHYFARQRAVHIATEYQQSLGASDPAQSIRRIGRNDPCYCGSGLKYKKCCGGIKVN